jgi:hypothetical protein
VLVGRLILGNGCCLFDDFNDPLLDGLLQPRHTREDVTRNEVGGTEKSPARPFDVGRLNLEFHWSLK